MLVDEVQQDGSIDKNEGELLKNAIDFSEQRAEDILIHRTDLAALPITATKEEVAALFTETKYSRLLIYQDSIDNILGTIHQKDFLCRLRRDGQAAAGYYSAAGLCAGDGVHQSAAQKAPAGQKRTSPSWSTNTAAPAAL